MLVSRILTGVVAIPILIGMAFDDGWLFLLGMLGTGALGTWEAVWMARQAGHRPLQPFSFLVGGIVLFGATEPSLRRIGLLGDGWWQADRLVAVGLGLIVACSLAAMLVRSEHQGSLADWSLTLALPLYVTGLLQFFAPLRYRADSGLLTWPALVLLTSWACDIAAYFAGRAFGRTRLAPRISPAKSVEGAVAGVVVAVLVGVAMSWLGPLGPVRMAGFGLAVGVGSVVGDLCESLLKRQCGVKDSGFLMPGHGGILDRMDALIFAATAAHFYLQVVA